MATSSLEPGSGYGSGATDEHPAAEEAGCGGSDVGENRGEEEAGEGVEEQGGEDEERDGGELGVFIEFQAAGDAGNEKGHQDEADEIKDDGQERAFGMEKTLAGETDGDGADDPEEPAIEEGAAHI